MTKPQTVAIEIGKEYEFVSEVEQETLPADERLCRFTGQKARVLRLLGPDENDPENSPLYEIEFPDGTKAHAWQEELDGWDKAKGQFFGPSGRWGDPS